jgi:hypothetical protein
LGSAMPEQIIVVLREQNMLFTEGVILYEIKI